jgi:MFS family permease
LETVGRNHQLTAFERTQSIITLVFFVTYIIFQPPATVLTRKLGPRNFLAGLCVAWGAVMIGMGFTKDWAAMAACRVILGLLEAGFFPVSDDGKKAWDTNFLARFGVKPC